MGNKVFQSLPDFCVIEIPAYVAENICGKEYIVRVSLLLASLRKPVMALILFSSVLGMEKTTPDASGNLT